MSVSNISNKRGFTIIEVVLVLAIAGLIFLMVFIALPNMQRSQRDTQRRNDYAALSANMTTYATNNNGTMPAAGSLCNDAATCSKYINSNGQDPNGSPYKVQVVKCTAAACVAPTGWPTSTQQVVVLENATCSDAGLPQFANKGDRTFAIYGYLEGGNGTYCSKNS